MRKEVKQFADLMEARLAEKDSKRSGNSWNLSILDELCKRLDGKYEAYSHVMILVRCNPDRVNKEKFKKLVADIANYTMMIADVVSGLEMYE